MSRFVRYLFVLHVAACASLGATWYVDKSAGGANTGLNWADAWSNLQSIAWSSVKPGATILFAAGDYTQDPAPAGVGRLTFGRDGLPGSPITVAIAQDVQHNGKVYLSGISFYGHSYVTVNGALNQSFPTNNLFQQNLWSITNNTGFVIHSPNNHGVNTSGGSHIRLLWCEIYACGAIYSNNMAGVNIHAFYSNANDPDHWELGYLFIHDQLYGDTINISGQGKSESQFPMNDIVLHHSILWNNGGDFLDLPAGSTVAWCKMRYRASTIAGGHVDIVQEWNGATNNTGNFLFHHNEVGDSVKDDKYGSWSYFQFSGTNGANVYVYDNAFYDTDVPATNQAASPWLWTSDAFWNNHLSLSILSNLFVFNNVFRAPMHQAMVWTSAGNQDYRSAANARGFVDHYLMTNVLFVNNIVVDCFTGQAVNASGVIKLPSQGITEYDFTNTPGPNGTLLPPLILWQTNDYSPASFLFLNNVVTGPNSYVTMFNMNYPTVEILDAAVGYTGNTSKRPLFSGSAFTSLSDFQVRASDTVVRNQGINLAASPFAAVITNLPDWNLDVYGNPRPGTGAWDIGPFQQAATGGNESVSPPSSFHVVPQR